MDYKHYDLGSEEIITKRHLRRSWGFRREFKRLLKYVPVVGGTVLVMHILNCAKELDQDIKSRDIYKLRKVCKQLTNDKVELNTVKGFIQRGKKND